MSLSTGGGGMILFWMPSMPAMTMAENSRYGFAVGSGARNSTRLDLGLPAIGMRMAAERFRAE